MIAIDHDTDLGDHDRAIVTSGVKGVFGLGMWTYFEIPAGTMIPPGLIITKDDYNARYQATHYSISPNYTMPKKQFTALLDQLAESARAQVRKAGGSGA
jgi:hypothetical protein